MYKAAGCFLCCFLCLEHKVMIDFFPGLSMYTNGTLGYKDHLPGELSGVVFAPHACFVLFVIPYCCRYFCT